LAGGEDFDVYYIVKALAAQDFDGQLEATTTLFSEFDAHAVVFQEEAPPLVDIIIPGQTVTGLVPPFNQYFIGKASGTQNKTIASTKWDFGDFSPTQTVSESGAGCYPIQHNFAASGFYVVRFTATDSDGISNSAVRFVNAASGIPESLISLSGVPQIGQAALSVAFSTKIEALPPGVSITSKLLTFDDGQTTISLNPTHEYPEPGIYRPVWCIRDSRGFIWCDSLDPGIDILK
jgi:PKD repeat protein